MQRRDFLKLLKGAGTALFLPTEAFAAASLPQLTTLFPDHLLDGFIDTRQLGIIQFGQKSQKHPYDDFASVGNQIGSLVECFNNPCTSSYRYVSPEVYLLNILSKDSLWNDSKELTVTLQDWAVFGSALEKRVASLSKLDDRDLLARFPKSTLGIRQPEPNSADFQDPIDFSMARTNFRKLQGPNGLVNSVRETLDYCKATNRDITNAFGGISKVLESPCESRDSTHRDVIAFLKHLQNSGFRSFAAGSRLEKLQGIARMLRQFNKLNGSRAGFDRLKVLAEDINRSAKEVSFKMPQTESLDSARFSQTFTEYQSRGCRAKRMNMGYQNEMLNNAQVPQDFCLLYNYRTKGPIVSLFMPEQNRFLPLHICHNEITKNIILNVLWENCSSALLVSQSPLLLSISRSPDDLVIKTMELSSLAAYQRTQVHSSGISSLAKSC